MGRTSVIKPVTPALVSSATSGAASAEQSVRNISMAHHGRLRSTTVLLIKLLSDIPLGLFDYNLYICCLLFNSVIVEFISGWQVCIYQMCRCCHAPFLHICDIRSKEGVYSS